jgi:arylsulfatase A-like enzyme
MPDKKAYVLPQTVSLLDIYPTLMEYCSLKPTNHVLDGKSIVPIFKDHNYQWNTPGFSCYGENYSSVRDQRYRYIRYPDGSDELYDHDKDPYEHHNLSKESSSKQIIKRLSASIPSKFAKSLGGKKENQAED